MTSAESGLTDVVSPEERSRFESLQRDFSRSFGAVFDDPKQPRTVLIVPSLSLDEEVMAKISGVHHYEERLLCLLMLLRMPRTKIVYLTSTPVHDSIIDYYLHLLTGVPAAHARRRLTLISCDDGSPRALSQKILARPRLIERIRQAIGDSASAHMTCFTVSELERKLALRLGIPIYGCDPSLLYWGSKSGSRKAFKEAGLDCPFGFEDLSDANDVAAALTELKAKCPEASRAVVKLNEGFSGEGNAMFDFDGAPEGGGLQSWVRARLPELSFEAQGMSWELYNQKLCAMRGIVEEFIPGATKRSPSAQARVTPNGLVEPISTHDQVLGGRHGHIFLGCRFPADAAYRLEIQDRSSRVAKVLASKGVLGRLGVDFVSVKTGDAWRHVAIEINLRKGGTTHPFLMLQFLTDGRYDQSTGEFLTSSGRPRYYFASDNIESPRYRGLTPDDLIDISVMNDLHYHAETGEGVAFHLIGALSEFGKLGIVCIGDSHERAEAFNKQAVAVLDAEGVGGSS